MTVILPGLVLIDSGPPHRQRDKITIVSVDYETETARWKGSWWSSTRIVDPTDLDTGVKVWLRNGWRVHDDAYTG